MLSTIVCLALAGQPMLSGREILKRSQAAYDAVKTFDENVSGVIDNYKGTAHIRFQRPGKLRVSGKSMFGSGYDLVCDGKSTWVLNGGNWSQQNSPELGIATITGISANAGTAVPAALFHCSWGSLASLAEPLKATHESLNGHKTFCVEASKPLPAKYWFDARTYFLVKSSMKVMGHTTTVSFGPPTTNRPIPAGTFKR